MLVEMQTGQPLFPGASDIDQLWLILKSFTEDQLLGLRGTPLFQVPTRFLLLDHPIFPTNSTVKLLYTLNPS
jgi:hypothetical protein